MKILILVTCLIWAVNAASFLPGALEEWMLFKQKYNKTYESDVEEKFRMMIYMDNKLFITEHNEKFEKGEVTFELGVNKFSDMLYEEFNKIYNGFKTTKEEEYNRILKGTTFKIPSNVKIPDEINWVEKGAVTPVKDQRKCGSCWAFSSTGSLEGQHFRKNGTLVSLSEQNLVDCSFKEGNMGCYGGQMIYAFEYVRINGGIDTESSYPYTALQLHCRYDPTHSGATDDGYVNIDSGDEEALKAAVATVGPISVAVTVNRAFKHYKSGVFVDATCKNGVKDINHGVLVVGYGTDEATGDDYWLVKNSWSDNWGDKGYIKMLRNAKNQCGIATAPVYPWVFEK